MTEVVEVYDEPTQVVHVPDLPVQTVDVAVVVGPRGPAGPAGEGAVHAHTHTQAEPAAVWTITHGLPFPPSLTVVDSAGSVVEGDVSYPSPSTVRVEFAGAFSGTAYLS